MKNSTTQGRDEGDSYRVLAQAVGNVNDAKAVEIEVHTAPKKPPMTVGAYKLRQRLGQMVDKVSGLPHFKNQQSFKDE